MKHLITACLMVLSLQTSAQDIPVWKGTDITAYIQNAPGEVAVINMWATFCKPCIEEIPDMIQLKHQWGDKLSLILVSLDLKGMYPVKLKRFIEKRGYDVPVVWLNETNADYFCPLLDPSWSGSIPATLIINTKTGYRKFYEEPLSRSEFQKAVEEAARS